MINRLKKYMQNYQLASLPEAVYVDSETGAEREKASVLIPIETNEEPELILTLRSSNLDAHGGEVAWPGGKQDEGETLVETALRETHEEIGVPPEKIEVIGELRPFVSKHGLLVVPFVALIESGTAMTPNLEELDAIFKVPVKWLLDDPRSDTNQIERSGELLNIPVYNYDGHCIWGLTAVILKELLIHGFDVEMD